MLSTHIRPGNPPAAPLLLPGVLPDAASAALDAACDLLAAARILWEASGPLDFLDALTVAADRLQDAADAAIAEALTAHAGRVQVAGVAS